MFEFSCVNCRGNERKPNPFWRDWVQGIDFSEARILALIFGEIGRLPSIVRYYSTLSWAIISTKAQPNVYGGASALPDFKAKLIADLAELRYTNGYSKRRLHNCNPKTLNQCKWRLQQTLQNFTPCAHGAPPAKAFVLHSVLMLTHHSATPRSWQASLWIGCKACCNAILQPAPNSTIQEICPNFTWYLFAFNFSSSPHNSIPRYQSQHQNRIDIKFDRFRCFWVSHKSPKEHISQRHVMFAGVEGVGGRRLKRFREMKSKKTLGNNWLNNVHKNVIVNLLIDDFTAVHFRFISFKPSPIDTYLGCMTESGLKRNGRRYKFDNSTTTTKRLIFR